MERHALADVSQRAPEDDASSSAGITLPRVSAPAVTTQGICTFLDMTDMPRNSADLVASLDDGLRKLIATWVSLSTKVPHLPVAKGPTGKTSRSHEVRVASSSKGSLGA